MDTDLWLYVLEYRGRKVAIPSRQALDKPALRERLGCVSGAAAFEEMTGPGAYWLEIFPGSNIWTVIHEKLPVAGRVELILPG